MLYGEGALPARVLEVLNNGICTWSHSPPAATALGSAANAPDSAAVATECRATLVEALRRRLLVVDEHPTLTRFFTFRVHVDGLLLISFLGIARPVFNIGEVKPLLKTSKRLLSVLTFLESPFTDQ